MTRPADLRADNPTVRISGLLLKRRSRRLVPFAAAALLPYALVVLPLTNWEPTRLALSAGLTLALGIACLVIPWGRLASWTHVLPSLGYLVAVVLLRDAGAGAGSGVGVLALLPVFWLALYGTRPQLAVVLVAVLAVFVAPTLLVGPPRYPATGVRGGLLFIAVAAIVGVTVQRLVGRIREQQREHDGLLAHFAELAYTDPLTGLPNRRAWTEALARALVVADETGEALTVALVDLDDFKTFNDSHGHDHGDRMLTQSAAAWRASLRPRDVVARLGGDEFAILLRGCDADSAARVLERMLAHSPGQPTCSVGFAEWDRRRSSAALVHEADVALYEAKRRGHQRPAPAARSRG